jgi:hypothetical protein
MAPGVVQEYRGTLVVLGYRGTDIIQGMCTLVQK